jgi:hypothetical protein
MLNNYTNRTGNPPLIPAAACALATVAAGIKGDMRDHHGHECPSTRPRRLASLLGLSQAVLVRFLVLDR